MEDIDLNLNNYNLDDILNLFDLKHDFTIQDIKNVKKKVLSLHPDKSNLDIKFYYFFIKAYRILISIYEFKNKNKNENTEYLIDIDKDNNNLLDNVTKDIKNSRDFNNWFNTLFEKNKLKNDYQDNGYGNWLKSQEGCSNIKCNNLNDVNEHIDNKKKTIRETSLTKYKDIYAVNENDYSNITNSAPDDYSSGIFSKLQYEDLRRAHEESVVPVTEEDYKKKYNNLDDIKNIRQQTINPLSKNKVDEILKNNKYKEEELSSHRAYLLAKQQEDVDNINKKWWSSLKQIRNMTL